MKNTASITSCTNCGKALTCPVMSSCPLVCKESIPLAVRTRAAVPAHAWFNEYLPEDPTRAPGKTVIRIGEPDDRTVFLRALYSATMAGYLQWETRMNLEDGAVPSTWSAWQAVIHVVKVPKPTTPGSWGGGTYWNGKDTQTLTISRKVGHIVVTMPWTSFMVKDEDSQSTDVAIALLTYIVEARSRTDLQPAPPRSLAQFEFRELRMTDKLQLLLEGKAVPCPKARDDAWVENPAGDSMPRQR
jgi:hypothetical protein